MKQLLFTFLFLPSGITLLLAGLGLGIFFDHRSDLEKEIQKELKNNSNKIMEGKSKLIAGDNPYITPIFESNCIGYTQSMFQEKEDTNSKGEDIKIQKTISFEKKVKPFILETLSGFVEFELSNENLQSITTNRKDKLKEKRGVLKTIETCFSENDLVTIYMLESSGLQNQKINQKVELFIGSKNDWNQYMEDKGRDIKIVKYVGFGISILGIILLLYGWKIKNN